MICNKNCIKKDLSLKPCYIICGLCDMQSDAMVVVYTKGRDGTLSELFRSEVVLNSLNPKWIKKLTISYQFEAVQTLL